MEENNKYDVINLVGSLAERVAVANTQIAVIRNMIRMAKKQAGGEYDAFVYVKDLEAVLCEYSEEEH